MRQRIIPYRSDLKVLARQLRKNGTLSEVLLWNQLKGKKLGGYQFLRQRPIDRYIVDFFCSELSLAIEIDGESHHEKIAGDVIRQKRLESLGISFLRFYDEDVKKNLEGVFEQIKSWIERFERHNQHPPCPLQRGNKRQESGCT